MLTPTCTRLIQVLNVLSTHVIDSSPFTKENWWLHTQLHKPDFCSPAREYSAEGQWSRAAEDHRLRHSSGSLRHSQPQGHGWNSRVYRWALLDRISLVGLSTENTAFFSTCNHSAARLSLYWWQHTIYHTPSKLCIYMYIYINIYTYKVVCTLDLYGEMFEFCN